MSNVKLIDPRRLHHIEGWSRKRARLLRKKIVAEGVWTLPLAVERTHLLVLDGQHRMEAALALGLERVPCALYDYDDVEVWSLRENRAVSRALVIERALSGDIYPYKTAKHGFPSPVTPVEIALDELKGRDR